MPQVTTQIPDEIFKHILDRVRTREIPISDIQELFAWIETKPLAPKGHWWHRLTNSIVVGHDAFPVSMLQPSMTPYGKQI